MSRSYAVSHERGDYIYACLGCGKHVLREGRDGGESCSIYCQCCQPEAWGVVVEPFAAPQPTRVIHVRDRHKYPAEEVVYIGRDHLRSGLRDIGFGNPYAIGRDGTREQVIAEYEGWIREQPALVERVKRELRGKVLCCWCSPLACHGEVLARIAEEE